MIFPLLFALACNDNTKETDTGDIQEDSAVVEEPSSCSLLELEEILFSEGPYGNEYGSIADDFTVSTLEGEWNFQENWSGCDSYLFVNHHSEYDYPNQIWNSSPRDLIDASPRNVHYFFMSYESGMEESAATDMRDRFEDALSLMSVDEQEYWRQRLHFVTTSAWEAGSIGTFLQNRGSWALAIDRQQSFREVGYLAMPPAFEGMMEALAYEAVHFNYLTDLQNEIDTLNSTPILAFDHEAIHNTVKDIELLDPQSLAAYDTLHLELQLECGDPYYENCGEWDKIAYAHLCAQADEENTAQAQSCQPYVAEMMGLCLLNEETTETTCRIDDDCVALIVEGEEETTTISCSGYEESTAADTLECDCTQPSGENVAASQTCMEDGVGFNDCSCPCDTEIGRWITSYARGGRWIIDASPLLSYLQSGAEQILRFSGPYSYENTLTFHFSNQEKNGTPQKIHNLFNGGSFNAEYNSRYEPMEIEIPAEATRVELYAVISGHGWGSEVENCAEFCNHTHHFTINETEYIFDHPEAGSAKGCIDQIAIGTTPNQFGTWPYGRGGWCPGKQVDPWIVDVTDAITPGETATITYRGLFNGDDYVPEGSGSGQGFGANIKMNSHLSISW